jgi:hypothetical protein
MIQVADECLTLSHPSRSLVPPFSHRESEVRPTENTKAD